MNADRKFSTAYLFLAIVLCGQAAEPGRAELTLKDSQGQKVRLRDLRGKLVVLNFWATWCGPCNAEMPMLVELEKEYGARGVVFIGASLDEPRTRGRIPEFIASHHVTFPIWYGASVENLDDMKLGDAVPATAFIDPDGRIVARILGQARTDEVKDRLNWLLGDRSRPAPEPLVKHLEK